MTENVTGVRKRSSRLRGNPKAGEAREAPSELVKGKLTDRRRAILNVAMRRFADFGFEATTVRQIAEDVNLLSGSLYHHFATKDEMLHEIVRDALIQMKDNVLRISRSKLNAEQRLIALILLDFGEMTRNQKVHAILTSERRVFRQKAEFAYVVKAKKETYQAWKAVIQDGIDSGFFRPDVDIFLAILTIIRMLNTAADWYKNDDAYISGKVGNYKLDEVIEFHIGFILGAIRLSSRTSEPIPREASEDLARFRD